MKFKQMLTILGVAGVALVSTVAVDNPASAADKVRNFVVACDKPGKATAFSWGENDDSAKIYFNNHCKHKVSVTLHFELKTPYPQPNSYTECLTTNGGTKGSKKFYFLPTYKLAKLSRGC